MAAVYRSGTTAAALDAGQNVFQTNGPERRNGKTILGPQHRT